MRSKPNIRGVQDLLDRWAADAGDLDGIAAAMGVPPARVQSFYERGTVPQELWPELVADAEARGFADVTLDAVMRIHGIEPESVRGALARIALVDRPHHGGRCRLIRLSDQLGEEVKTIHQWYARNALPARIWSRMADQCKARKLPYTVKDFEQMHPAFGAATEEA